MLPKFLGLNTDAMMMPASFAQARYISTALILAVLGLTMGLIAAVLLLLSSISQTESTSKLLNALNQSAPDLSAVLVSQAVGPLGILLVACGYLTALFVLLAALHSYAKSIQKDDLVMVADCISRLEKMDAQFNKFPTGVMNDIILSAGVYHAGTDPVEAGLFEHEVRACLLLLKRIEQEAHVTHGALDQRKL